MSDEGLWDEIAAERAEVEAEERTEVEAEAAELAARFDASGLFPTPIRVKLLVAIQDGKGRIYKDSTGVYDASSGAKVTERLRAMVDAGWVRAKTDDDPFLTGEWSRSRIYYRLTDLGHAAIERGRR